MSDKKIGFVGGGQMATALAQGAIAARVCAARDLVFAEPAAGQQELLHQRFPDAMIFSDAGELVDQAERIFLAVKPHILKQESARFGAIFSNKHLLVSIAAGISLEHLKSMLGSDRIIRVMPNTPCQVGEAASAFSVTQSVSSADIDWIQNLLGSVGHVERVPDHLMHAITGVSGSSPAYIYLVIEALSDGGVAQGLPRDVATKMAAQAVLGAAKMVLETGLHPGVLKDQVTSPGGTTIAALRELEAAGTRSAFIEAVAACVQRSEELA